MRNKIISVAEAVDMIPDGATIMYGGFLGCGSAHHIIDALAEKGTKDLTIIGNDCGMATGPCGEEYYGVAKLVHNHQVKHVIATHVGMTPDVGTQGMVDKTLTVDLIPQGSLAEMIRAGGAGLGGVLTPTGVGTIVEDSPFCLGKQTIDGKEYLLTSPCSTATSLTSSATSGTRAPPATSTSSWPPPPTWSSLRRTTWWISATLSPRTWSPPAPLSITSWMEGMCNG